MLFLIFMGYVGIFGNKSYVRILSLVFLKIILYISNYEYIVINDFG